MRNIKNKKIDNNKYLEIFIIIVNKMNKYNEYISNNPKYASKISEKLIEIIDNDDVEKLTLQVPKDRYIKVNYSSLLIYSVISNKSACTEYLLSTIRDMELS